MNDLMLARDGIWRKCSTNGVASSSGDLSCPSRILRFLVPVITRYSFMSPTLCVKKNVFLTLPHLRFDVEVPI